jgi:hypothetical protein
MKILILKRQRPAASPLAVVRARPLNADSISLVARPGSPGRVYRKIVCLRIGGAKRLQRDASEVIAGRVAISQRHRIGPASTVRVS